ncbi:hypothetical protein [Rathayibacter sp. VKM Ac-2630]|uniref:hypothetical protein n=1 Tax=Rathayibacter sp. VKM Ac-2630 TaxID=1938617 RepID=UPI001300ED66|nr:hypothetical protein [Rathayibacter sp. VKM Ac-2630]
MSELISYVTVHDEDGVSHTFAPGDEVPAWAVKAIQNKSVFKPARASKPDEK